MLDQFQPESVDEDLSPVTAIRGQLFTGTYAQEERLSPMPHSHTRASVPNSIYRITSTAR